MSYPTISVSQPKWQIRCVWYVWVLSIRRLIRWFSDDDKSHFVARLWKNRPEWNITQNDTIVSFSMLNGNGFSCFCCCLRKAVENYKYMDLCKWEHCSQFGIFLVSITFSYICHASTLHVRNTREENSEVFHLSGACIAASTQDFTFTYFECSTVRKMKGISCYHHSLSWKYKCTISNNILISVRFQK